MNTNDSCEMPNLGIAVIFSGIAVIDYPSNTESKTRFCFLSS